MSYLRDVSPQANIAIINWLAERTPRPVYARLHRGHGAPNFMIVTPPPAHPDLCGSMLFVSPEPETELGTAVHSAWARALMGWAVCRDRRPERIIFWLEAHGY